MYQTTIFDVLIVYSEKLATSASSLSENINTPFALGSVNTNYNLVYSYFLKTCKNNNLKAAFTTSADIIDAGKCSSYWLFKNNIWVKIKKNGFSKLIFDKFSPTSIKIKDKRKLLFSLSEVKAFNTKYLFDLCFDKQKTYDKLCKFSIPTVAINGGGKKEIEKACKALKIIINKSPYKNDFSDETIMKDRFGAGGKRVFKFKNNESNIIIDVINKHKKRLFVIQPFVKFDQGYKYKKVSFSTDIRLIFLGQKIIQTYIRMAKNGDFRCNEHAGGLLKYIPINKVPSKIIAISSKISNILNDKSSLYSLDFIISNNNNIYLLEANTGPGLDWNLSLKENEIEAKKLITIIVKEIGKRCNTPIIIYKEKFDTEVNTDLFSGAQFL